MEIFIVITQSLFAIAIAGFGLWFPSYIKKKAENAAQKQDLKDLTQIVKEVEQKFTTETEKLKAQLSLINQLQANFYKDEKEALLNLHVALLDCFLVLVDFSMSHSSIEQIMDIGDKRNKTYSNVLTSIMKLGIFSDTALNIEASQLRDHMATFNDRLFVLANNYISAIQEDQPHNSFEQQMHSIFLAHKGETEVFVRDISPKLDIFTGNIREYLKQQSKI